jgi:hypothetical protein
LENINITIQQAYYGEVNRSHGCLASTIEDSDLRSFLTAFTDRPGSLTAGTPLSAYYSGISHGANYILTRTIADGTASRGGMVFTHALIIRSADLHSINDLNKLLLYFAAEKPTANFSLTPLVIPGGELTEKPVHVHPSIYLRKVVAGLIANQGPVLFCGELASFESVLSTIWGGLPSSFRKGLSFTTAFSTNALDAEKKLIYVQKDLLPVFRKSGPVTDDEITNATELSEVEKFILSQNGENEFDTFIKLLEVDLNDWAILAPCVRAYHLYVKVSVAITADELRLLIRNLAKISPGAGTGVVIKTAAITKLSGLIRDGMDTNLKALRNLGLQEFAGGTEVLSNAIRELLAGMFAKTIPMATDVVDELFLTVQPDTAATWWQRAVSAALSAAGLLKRPKPMEMFWSLLNRKDAPAEAILAYLDHSLEMEEILIKNLPGTLNAHSSAIIAKLIQPRKWFLLHARLIKEHGGYKETVIEQFNYESAYHANSFPGTRYLLPELKDNDLLSVCFETGNELFINNYAERAVMEPVLLAAINLNKPVWLAIWSVSLDKTKDLSHGITDSDKVVGDVFDLLLKNISIPNNILNLVATNSYADITNHNQRPLLWQKLPTGLVVKFLTATAGGFVTKVVTGTITASPESELTEAIGQDAFIPGSYLIIAQIWQRY